MLNDTLSNPVNYTSPTQTTRFTLHAAKQGVAIAYVMKSAKFWSECGRDKCFFGWRHR